jgi:hypothetical protein
VTIEKGRPWGAPWAATAGAGPVEAESDADLARLLAPSLVGGGAGNEERRADGARAVAAGAEIVLRSGDLLRTIGLERPRPPAERYRYPIDVGIAHLGRSADGDGERGVVAPFVAHLTVRDRPLVGLGPGLSVAVMNAAWLGDLRLGPRAHPNDGLLDVSEGTVGLTQRREADRRARTGSHLPHPGLRTSRVRRWEHSWGRPVPVWLDGVRRGRFRSVVVEVVPDGAAVVA